MNKLFDRLLGYTRKQNPEEQEKLEKDIEEFVEMIEQSQSIQSLLAERDELYEYYTQELLVKIKPVIDAAQSFLDDEIVKLVEWKAVELLEESHTVMALGAVVFPIGSKVVIDDEGMSIEVNEENQKAFQRVMRIVVPLELAERGEPEELKSFFREHYSLENLPEQVDPSEEFSTEELTAEQIEKMNMFTNLSKDKPN